MTCIVGIADGTKVWMGADTYGSDKWTGSTVTHPKVFILEVPAEGSPNEELMIGGCGSFRMLQLLEHGLATSMPGIRKNQSVINWLTIEFADATRHLFREKGFGKNADGIHSINGGSFLLGFRGNIYHIEDSYQAIAVPENIQTAGSGGPYALASLVTTRNFGWTPLQRIQTALEVAAEINLQTAPPFVYYDI
jgi:hypothetical protein